MWRVESLEKTLMLGGIGGKRRRGWQRMRWLDGITDSMDWVWVNSGSWWWAGRPGVLWFMGSQRVGHDWATDLIWVIRNREHLFMYLLVICMSSKEKCLVRFSAHFKNWNVCFFVGGELYEFFISFECQPLTWHMVCRYLFPFGMQPFCFVDGSLTCAEAFTFDVVPFADFCFFVSSTFGVRSA